MSSPDPMLSLPRIAPPGVAVAPRIHRAGAGETSDPACVDGGRHVFVVGGPYEGDRACFLAGQSLDDGDVVGLAADPGVPYLLRRNRRPGFPGGPARLLWLLYHPSAVTLRRGSRP